MSTEHSILRRTTRFWKFITCGTQMAPAETDAGCCCQSRTSTMVSVIKSIMGISRNTVNRNIRIPLMSLWERTYGASRTLHCLLTSPQENLTHYIGCGIGQPHRMSTRAYQMVKMKRIRPALISRLRTSIKGAPAIVQQWTTLLASRLMLLPFHPNSLRYRTLRNLRAAPRHQPLSVPVRQLPLLPTVVVRCHHQP